MGNQEDLEEEVASTLREEGALEAYQEGGMWGTALEVVAVLAALAASCSLNEEAAVQVEAEGAGPEVEVQEGGSCQEEVAVEVVGPARAGLARVVHQQRAGEACLPAREGSGQPGVFRRLIRGARP